LFVWLTHNTVLLLLSRTSVLQELEAATPLLTSLALSSSSSTFTAAAPAVGAAAISHALVNEANRRLVDALLVAVAKVPVAALPGAEALLALSPGTAELLLKQLDGLLQVCRCGV
jgi:hypothetical protein